MAKKPNPPAPKQAPSNRPAQQQVSMQQWQGPLPPPGALAQFNNVIPNGAERIMAMVEEEQKHRIRYEEGRLDAAIKDGRRGRWMGFALGIACVVGAVIAVALHAHPSVSIALVSLPMVAAIKALIGSGRK